MKLRTLLLSAALLLTTTTAAVAAPDRSDRNDRRHDLRVQQRDHRVGRAWTDLGTVRTAGKTAALTLDRATSIDELRVEVSRGTASVKKVIVIFADGSRYVAAVGERLTAGESKVIKIVGANKRVASIELRLASGNARKAGRTQIAVSAR